MAKQEKKEMGKRERAMWLDRAFDQMSDPMILIDKNLEVVEANDAAANLVGLRKGELAGTHCGSIFTCEKGGYHCFGRRLLESNQNRMSGEHVILGSDGMPVHVFLTVSKLLDENGEAAGFVEVIQDMEDIGAINMELLEKARTDPLTRLGNRRTLFETLGVESARAVRHDRPYSLLILDIDHFKGYNDAHGHLAGDEALKFVADALRESSRREDLVTRYGGEEFVLILPETDSEGALIKAERLRALIKETSGTSEELKQEITVSIGVSECEPGRRCIPSELLSSADAALYDAKKTGRDKVIISKKKS